MSDSKKIVYDSFALLTGRIGGMVISVGFTVYFAHKLSKTEFATIAVFEILTALTNMISNLGLETYCLREVPSFIKKNDLSKASAYIKTAIANRLLWSILAGILIILSQENCAKIFFKDAAYAQIFLFLGVGVVASSLNTSLGLIAHSVKAFKETAFINIIRVASFCILSFVLYYFYGYIGWVIGYTLSRVIGCVLFFILLKKWFFYSKFFYSWSKMVKTAYPYYLRGFAKYGLLNLDQAIISIFMSPGMLATYYVAKKFPKYISIIIEATGRPLLIKLSEFKNEKREKIQNILAKISIYNSWLFVPICMGIAVYGYFLLDLFGGKKYTDGLPILVLLCLAKLLKGLFFSLYENGVFIFEKPYKVFLVDLAGCLSNIILLILFVPFFGAVGVALAVLLSTAVAQYCAGYFLNKIFDVKFNINAFYKVCGAMALFSITGIILQILFYDIYLIPLYIVVSLIVFFVFTANIITEEDILMLKSILPERINFVFKFLNFISFRQTAAQGN